MHPGPSFFMNCSRVAPNNSPLDNPPLWVAGGPVSRKSCHSCDRVTLSGKGKTTGWVQSNRTSPVKVRSFPQLQWKSQRLGAWEDWMPCSQLWRWRRPRSGEGPADHQHGSGNLRCTVTENWVLLTTWMSSEADSSPALHVRASSSWPSDVTEGRTE